MRYMIRDKHKDLVHIMYKQAKQQLQKYLLDLICPSFYIIAVGHCASGLKISRRWEDFR